MVRVRKPSWLALALLLLWPWPAKGVEFADVGADAWYREDLRVLAEMGAVSGVRSGSGEVFFEPGRLVTRAEFLKMCLHALARGPRLTITPVFPAPGTPPFVDVSTSAWYAGYVAFAKQWEIIDSTLPRFEPEASMTRQNGVRIVVKTLDLNGGARELQESRFFSDANADPYISKAVRAKLVGGYPDGTFRPSQALNRAEAVAMIARAIRNVEEPPQVRFGMIAFTSENPLIPEVGFDCTCDCTCPTMGIRLNRPDSSKNLLRVHLSATPPPSDGTYYALTRNNSAIKVWPSKDKSQPPYLDENDSYTFSATPLPIAKDVYVENAAYGEAVLSLELRRRSDGGLIHRRDIAFHTFDAMVVVLAGEDLLEAGNDLPSPYDGIGNVARLLHERGYDVYLYNEDYVDEDGNGLVYSEIIAAALNRFVRRLALIGFSHGGGSVFDLAERIDSDDSLEELLSIGFTTYVDAISNDSNVTRSPVIDRPPGSDFHLNIYQTKSSLRGADILDSDAQLIVTNANWGTDLGHIDSIANDRHVWDEIISRLVENFEP